MDDINEIVVFEGKTPSAPAQEAGVIETASPAEPKATTTQERDESGKFKASEPVKEPVPEPKEPEKKQESQPAAAQSGQMAALLAERARRQQAEADRQKLEAELQRLRSGGTEQPATADFYANPEQAVDERVARHLAPFRQTFISQSIELASRSHEDFDDAIKHLMEAADQNPELQSMLVNHENPGEFAYFIGSTTPAFRQSFAQKHTQRLGEKDAEIATLKARIAELESGQKAVAALPESLNRQPSGSVPARDSNDMDIRNIVRFK